MSPRPEPALFGKLPSTLDFIRVNHTSPAGIAYDAWTERCLHELARMSCGWPNLKLRFFLPSPEGGQTLIGLVAPSKDRAGRKFPVTLYFAVPGARWRGNLSSLPSTWAIFFESAERALERAASLKGAELQACVASVEVPTAEQAVAAERLDRDLREQNMADTEAAETAGAWKAALLRLRSNIELSAQSRERAPVVDMPLQRPADPGTWLALVERTSSASQRTPWSFWHPPCEEKAGRMLLGFGNPPHTLPGWFAQTRPSSDRLLPVETQNAQTAAQAEPGLAPSLADLLWSTSRAPTQNLLTNEGDSG